MSFDRAVRQAAYHEVEALRGRTFGSGLHRALMLRFGLTSFAASVAIRVALAEYDRAVHARRERCA